MFVWFSPLCSTGQIYEPFTSYLVPLLTSCLYVCLRLLTCPLRGWFLVYWQHCNTFLKHNILASFFKEADSLVGLDVGRFTGLSVVWSQTKRTVTDLSVNCLRGDISQIFWNKIRLPQPQRVHLRNNTQRFENPWHWMRWLNVVCTSVIHCLGFTRSRFSSSSLQHWKQTSWTVSGRFALTSVQTKCLLLCDIISWSALQLDDRCISCEVLWLLVKCTAVHICPVQHFAMRMRVCHAYNKPVSWLERAEPVRYGNLLLERNTVSWWFTTREV